VACRACTKVPLMHLYRINLHLAMWVFPNPQRNRDREVEICLSQFLQLAQGKIQRNQSKVVITLGLGSKDKAIKLLNHLWQSFNSIKSHIIVDSRRSITFQQLWVQRRSQLKEFPNRVQVYKNCPQSLLHVKGPTLQQVSKIRLPV
jgi:hypothetical protein